MNPFVFKGGDYNDYIEITNFLSKTSKGKSKISKDVHSHKIYRHFAELNSIVTCDFSRN